MIARRALLAALLTLALLPAVAKADFGFKPGSVTMSFEDEEGNPVTQAGAHPYALKLEFALNTKEGGQTEGGAMRDLIVDLPPGLIGNPQALAACSRQDFEAAQCSGATQIGVLHTILPGVGEALGALYNLVPPPGSAAQVGFSNLGFTLLGSAGVRTEEGYGVRVTNLNLPLEASAGTATIWGTPADESHDFERGNELQGESTDAAHLPYLTLPTSCQAAPELTLRADSKFAPGAYAPETVSLLDEGGNPQALSGCEAVPFNPSLAAAPSTDQAESASGLGLQLSLPNKGLLNPKAGAVVETEPRKLSFTLPQGFTANPAAANGQGACSEEAYEHTACPSDSKLGTLTGQTPLLEEAFEGSVYLAKPHANPFDSLLAIYVIAQAPERGVTIKQAGLIEADPTTGQLTTTIEGLPPVPYSSVQVNLREGPRAPLITPQACGSYRATAKLYPFSDPEAPTTKSVPLDISTGTGGAPCASGEAGLPNVPGFDAGSLTPLAGSFTPFTTRIARQDGSQRFSSLNVTLPKGLSAKLAGTAQCSDAQIASAVARSHEGQGALELASPSCPANSQVATVNAGAGAGQPYYVPGKAYLAGPYKGAPLSLAIITPAVAGPFDLGVVVVRAALQVSEETAQASVQSDPLPSILHGVPLDVRSASVQVDKQEFTLNPTSCDPTEVKGSLSTLAGQSASLTSRFQVGGCEGLGFKPSLRIAFKGKTNRGAHPQLTATLTPRPGDANVSFAQVKLPPTAFLDQAHIKTVCTRVQFAADQCPAASIYGSAEAITPLLGYPLKGNVYLRSSSHVLPDLVVAFKGPDYQPIKFALAGVTDSVHGALRNTFEAPPDVPVSSFRLKLFGGKRGLVVLTDGFCADRSALVRMRAHNGRTLTAHPKVQAACRKAKAKRSKRKGSG